jgi:hypothetical protein
MNTSTVGRRRALSPGLIILLIVGDAAVLLAFSALGRASHSLRGATPLLSVLLTAAPFAVAWAIVAPLAFVFGRGTQALTSLVRWLLHTGLTWVVAGPLGLVLRSLWLERPIVPTFAAVTMATVMAMLLIWRGLYWLLYRRLA